MTATGANPRIGLALGSGSARGWAHIGVIRELERLGITPQVVCGTSIGALVGGLYAAGQLDRLESWIRRLDWREILRYLDVTLLMGGGFVEGKRLIDFFRDEMGDHPIESLDIPFAAVATDLSTGEEVWFREGSLLDAIRASFALPGLFTPAQLDNRWLVDGGLVNPVPVSLCRALGADVVIAVNLNGDVVGKHLRREETQQAVSEAKRAEVTLIEKLSEELKQRTNSLVSQLFESSAGAPGLFDVVAGSINIMQHRITRSRMAGDPPDIVLTPRLAHIGLMEFDRAQEAITEGAASANRAAEGLQELAAGNNSGNR
jgi:NTE family protein